MRRPTRWRGCPAGSSETKPSAAASSQEFGLAVRIMAQVVGYATAPRAYFAPHS
jgi:hypothetical protein